jgi:MFS family permease
MNLVERYRAQLGISMRVVRAVIGSPALRRVESAFLLFNIVEFAPWVAILLYAYAAIGPASVGIVAVIQLVPGALVAPLTASLADRFPRPGAVRGYGPVRDLRFDPGRHGDRRAGDRSSWRPVATSLTITRPTQGSLLPSLARTPEELTAANGLSGAMEGAGMLLGPLIAAAILAVATPTAVFAAATVACLAAATLVFHLPTPRSPVAMPVALEPGAPADRSGLLEGLRLAARSGDTRLVVGILSLRMVVIGALDVLFILLALEVFDIGESGAGLLNAALGLGVVVGGAITFTFVGRQRLAPVLAVAALMSGFALVVVGTVAPVSVAAPLIVMTGIGFAGCDIVGRTILQRVTPDLVLARVLGALEGISFASLALGAILAPLVVVVAGVQGALVVAGLLLPAGIALSWLGLRAMDRHTLVPMRALGLLGAVEIFKPMPPPQLEWVARRARWITFEPGEAVIIEGDIGDAYYILESGALRVTKGGEALLRALTGRGDAVGEIALLRGVPRTATVVATGTSVMLMRVVATRGRDRARAGPRGGAAGRGVALGPWPGRRATATVRRSRAVPASRLRRMTSDAMSTGRVPQQPPSHVAPKPVQVATVVGSQAPPASATHRRAMASQRSPPFGYAMSG